MDRGAWQATVHEVTRVGHNWATEHTCMHKWVVFETYRWAASLQHETKSRITKDHNQRRCLTRTPRSYLSIHCCCCCCCSVTQSCLTLCNPMDCSQPGSSVHGIFQARIMESVFISSSRASSWPRDQTYISQADSLPLSHQGSPEFCSSPSRFSHQNIWPTFPLGLQELGKLKNCVEERDQIDN